MKKLLGTLLLAPLAVTSCTASTSRTQEKLVYGYVSNAYARAHVTQKDGVIKSVSIDRTVNADYAIDNKTITDKAEYLDKAKDGDTPAVKNGFSKEGYKQIMVSVNKNQMKEVTAEDGTVSKVIKSACFNADSIDLTGEDDVAFVVIEGADIGGGTTMTAENCAMANGTWVTGGKQVSFVSTSWVGNFADDIYNTVQTFDASVNPVNATKEMFTVTGLKDGELSSVANVLSAQASHRDNISLRAIEKFFTGKAVSDILDKTYSKDGGATNPVTGSMIDSTANWAQLIVAAATL